MVVKTFNDDKEEIGLNLAEVGGESSWEDEAPQAWLSLDEQNKRKTGLGQLLGKQQLLQDTVKDDNRSVQSITKRREEVSMRSSQHSSSSMRSGSRHSRRKSIHDSTWTTALVSQAYNLVSHSHHLREQDNRDNNNNDDEEPTARFNRISSSQHSRKKKKRRRKSNQTTNNNAPSNTQQSLLAFAVEEKKKKLIEQQRQHSSLLPSFQPIDWHMETPTKEAGVTKAAVPPNDPSYTPATTLSNHDDDDDDIGCPLWDEMKKNQSADNNKGIYVNDESQILSSTRIDSLQVKSMEKTDPNICDGDDWKEHGTNINLSSASNTTSQTTTIGGDDILMDDLSVMALEGRHPILAELLDMGCTLLRYMKNRCWKKKALMISVIILFILVVIDIFFLGNIKSWLIQYVEWMEDHILLGGILFIGLLVITTLCFIPPIFLTFGCGYIFAKYYSLSLAVMGATFTCFVGASIGAMVSFLRARYMMRDLIHLFAQRYSTVGAVDRAIVKKGFRIMVLLRLCPIIPFNALNYIGGITNIHLETFMYSLIGILPMQILTVAMGATTGDFRWNGMIVTKDSNADNTHKQVRRILMIIGIVFATVAMVIAYRYAKKELQKEFDMLELKANVKQYQEEEDDDEVVVWKPKSKFNQIHLDFIELQKDDDDGDDAKERNDSNSNAHVGGAVSLTREESWEDECQQKYEDKEKDIERGQSETSLFTMKNDINGKRKGKPKGQYRDSSKTKGKQKQMNKHYDRQQQQQQQQQQKTKGIQQDEHYFGLFA